MSDKLLDRYLGKRTDDAPARTDPGDELDDFGSFGWLRGIRDRAIMLEIRHKDGKVTAYGYAWLDTVEFDPSEGITLRFSGKQVKILGTHLDAEIRPNIRLLDGLLRHRVAWIAERRDSFAVTRRTGEPVIDEISLSS